MSLAFIVASVRFQPEVHCARHGVFRVFFLAAEGPSGNERRNRGHITVRFLIGAVCVSLQLSEAISIPRKRSSRTIDDSWSPHRTIRHLPCQRWARGGGPH